MRKMVIKFAEEEVGSFALLKRNGRRVEADKKGCGLGFPSC
jgi:hypothetical protein